MQLILPENVLAGMVSSTEFFQSAGDTNRGWVTEMYRLLLNRQPEGTGLDFWTNHLDQRTLTRPQVVLSFVKSRVNFTNLVREWHQTYLNRQATQQEVDRFVAQLLSGTSQRSVQIQLIDTAEYLNAPPPPDAGVARRV